MLEHQSGVRLFILWAAHRWPVKTIFYWAESIRTGEAEFAAATSFLVASFHWFVQHLLRFSFPGKNSSA